MRTLLCIGVLVVSGFGAAEAQPAAACFCPPGHFCIPELPPCLPRATCPPVGTGPCVIRHG
jgi:hypothetical protein